MLNYGKPDGKDTKRGHVVVTASTLPLLIEEIERYMKTLLPMSVLPWRKNR